MVDPDDGLATVVTSEETKGFVEAYKEQGFTDLDDLGLPFAVQCCVKATISAGFSSNAPALFVLTVGCGRVR